MKQSLHEAAVTNLAELLAEIYFKPNALLEWEDLDEAYDAVSNLLAYKKILERRRKVISRGTKQAFINLSRKDGMLVRYSVINYKDVKHRVESFIDVIVTIGKYVDYDQFIRIAKMLKFIPEDCPAADIQYLHI